MNIQNARIGAYMARQRADSAAVLLQSIEAGPNMPITLEWARDNASAAEAHARAAEALYERAQAAAAAT